MPDKTNMREFTFRAVLLGLVMTVILGAANAYLGLRAGMTIAATYPAAVIGMAMLRLMKGSILEENIARTIGSIGESVAAGAIFTIPAFVLVGRLAVVRLRRRLLEIDGADGGGRHAGHPVRDAAAPRDGGRSGAAVPGIGGGGGDPQGRPAGRQAATLLFQHGRSARSIYFLGAIKLFAAEHGLLVQIGELGTQRGEAGQRPRIPRR